MASIIESFACFSNTKILQLRCKFEYDLLGTGENENENWLCEQQLPIQIVSGNYPSKGCSRDAN